MDTRIENVNRMKSEYNNIYSCFTIDDNNLIKGTNGELFKIIQVQGSGSFNTTYKICEILDGVGEEPSIISVLTEDNNKCKNRERYIFRKHTRQYPDKKREKQATYNACISDRYSLLFSNIVLRNIFPNFPLIINSYLCDDDYYTHKPITIQEYATDGDLKSFLSNPDNDSYAKHNLNLQSIITYYFMNNRLEICHMDAKPANVLVLDIPETNIAYKYYSHKNNKSKYIKIKTDKLALVTDFDFTLGTQNSKDIFFQMDNYMNFILYQEYRRESNKMRLISVFDKRNKRDSQLISVGDFLMNGTKYVLNLNIDNIGDSIFMNELKMMYRKIKRENLTHIRDIFTHLILAMYTILEYKIVYFEFLKDLIINEKDFFECIHEYFDEVIEEIGNDEQINLEIYKHVYDINIEHHSDKEYINRLIISLDEKGFQQYYRCVLQDVEFRNLKFGDKYFSFAFEREYRLSRFLHTTKQMYYSKIHTIPNFNEESAKQIKRFLKRVCKLQGYTPQNIQSHLIPALNLFKFVISNSTRIAPSDYKVCAIMCLYLFTNLTIDLCIYYLSPTESLINDEKLFRMLNDILNLLKSYDL